MSVDCLTSALPTDTPAVTVVVPAYNQAPWLSDTLNSVVAQSFADWECIVVNDGSTDATPRIAGEFVARDTRFQLLSQPNGGVSAARNLGLQRARGQYVVFLDGDDLLLPNKLRFELAWMKADDLDVGITALQVNWMREPNHPLHGRIWSAPEDMPDPFQTFLRSWEVDFALPPVVFMVKRSFIMNAGIQWDTRLYSHEDWDFWLQVLQAGPKLGVSAEVLASYRVHGAGVTAQRYRCWRGYLMSWRIQSGRYAQMPGAAEALRTHRHKMHRSYRRSFPFRSWLLGNLVNRNWFRAHCPWRLQAPLRRFCGV